MTDYGKWDKFVGDDSDAEGSDDGKIDGMPGTKLLHGFNNFIQAFNPESAGSSPLGAAAERLMDRRGDQAPEGGLRFGVGDRVEVRGAPGSSRGAWARGRIAETWVPRPSGPGLAPYRVFVDPRGDGTRAEVVVSADDGDCVRAAEPDGAPPPASAVGGGATVRSLDLVEALRRGLIGSGGQMAAALIAAAGRGSGAEVRRCLDAPGLAPAVPFIDAAAHPLLDARHRHVVCRFRAGGRENAGDLDVLATALFAALAVERSDFRGILDTRRSAPKARARVDAVVALVNVAASFGTGGRRRLGECTNGDGATLLSRAAAFPGDDALVVCRQILNLPGGAGMALDAALYAAARDGRPKLVTLLADRGAAVDAVFSGGGKASTPLAAALSRDLGDVAALLLRRGADPLHASARLSRRAHPDKAPAAARAYCAHWVAAATDGADLDHDAVAAELDRTRARCPRGSPLAAVLAACAERCWNQSPVDGWPGISSNSSVSLKSNSFFMILEPLILASRVLGNYKPFMGEIRSESARVEGILKSLFPS